MVRLAHFRVRPVHFRDINLSGGFISTVSIGWNWVHFKAKTFLCETGSFPRMTSFSVPSLFSVFSIDFRVRLVQFKHLSFWSLYRSLYIGKFMFTSNTTDFSVGQCISSVLLALGKTGSLQGDHCSLRVAFSKVSSDCLDKTHKDNTHSVSSITQWTSLFVCIIVN